MPTRRFAELTVLRAHPALWQVCPGGDLSAMPRRLFWELWHHARAEWSEQARATARALAEHGVRL